MAYNDDVKNVILGYDNNLRNNYSLFSFLDASKNKYSTVGTYNDNIVDFLNDFKPYILGESTPLCIGTTLTAADRENYEFKISALENILNKCNATSIQNKQQCLYDEFMKEPTFTLVKDLTAIVQKINQDCIFSKISDQNATNICRDNSNNMLNTFSNNDILKTQNFLNKYTSIISDLKRIADTNTKAYLTKCNQDPARIKTYNDTQALLAQALFINYGNTGSSPSSECTPERICTPAVCSNQAVIKSQINDLNSQITGLKENCKNVENTDLLWDSNLSMRNGYVIACIIIFLVIVIISLVIIVFAVRKQNSSKLNISDISNESNI
jgi:hypothetical protein